MGIFGNLLKTFSDVETFDEVLQTLETLSEKEKKFTDLEKTIQEFLKIEDYNELVDNLVDFEDFYSNYGYQYGYPGLNISEQLKKAIAMDKIEDIKKILQSILDSIQKIKSKTTKNDEGTDKNDTDSTPMTVNLFNQEIAAPGNYGEKGILTEEDMKKMVENYNKTKDVHEIPLTLGHLKALEIDGLPSLGWARNLRFEDGKVVADFFDVPKKIADKIRMKGYLNKSPVIYSTPPPDLKEKFGVDGYMIKEVALLGMDVPEMKTLNNLDSLYYKEGSYLLRKEVKNDKKEDDMGEMVKLGKEKLQSLIEKATRLEVKEFIEGAKREGKITPAMEPVVNDILMSVWNQKEEVITFSEEDGKKEKATIKDAVCKLIDSIPKIIDFSEIHDDGQKKKKEFEEELDERIQKKIADAKKNGIDLSYSEAFDVVTEEMEEEKKS